MQQDSLTHAESNEYEVKLPKEVCDRILMNTDAVTMLPQHATKALAYLDDPDVSVKVVSDVIEQDVMLATDNLAIANSAIFAAGKTIVDLTKAITRVGSSRCKNIIIASSIKCAMKDVPLSEVWVKEVLTRHGFLTGLLAATLNRQLRCGFGGEEFAAGLIHDFGRLLLAVTYPEEFANFDPLDFDESRDVLKREEAAIGTNHAEAGAWFVAQQGLPPVLCEVVRFHHEPRLITTNEKLGTLIACADHLANHYQRFADTQTYETETNPFLARLEELGVSNAVAHFDESANDMLECCANDANSLMS